MDGGKRTGAVVSDARSLRHVCGEQPQQRRVIRWERFLPRRSLRVLLVEHDDSTRHIVTALLRKCSYHVSAVADGLKAWDVMKEKHYRYDFVLAEVEIPSLSGIGLLSKIMECEPSKSIPVIMMSSHDSVSVVYQCMLRGAVDFLVKPVRRNELRNLWQHVWRKHCSTSYAHWPESINYNNKKSVEMSDNNAASNHVSANRSRNKERSDEGSDAQSSESKSEKEIQSMERHREPNSTDCENFTVLIMSKLVEACDQKLLMETESEIYGAAENNLRENHEQATSTEMCKEHHFVNTRVSCMEKQLNNKSDFISPETDHDFLQHKPSEEIIDFIGTVDNDKHSHEKLEKDDVRDANQPETIKSQHTANGHNSDDLPSWELSLRGPYINVFSQEVSQEWHILKRSSASAFSRYSTDIYKKTKSSWTTLSTTRKEDNDQMQLQLNNHVSDKEDLASPKRRLTSSQQNETQDIISHGAASSHNRDDGHFAAGPSECAHVTHSSDEGSNQNVSLPTSQLGLVPHSFPGSLVSFQSLCAGYVSTTQPTFFDQSAIDDSGGIEKSEEPRSIDVGHNVDHVIYNIPPPMLQHQKEVPHSRPLEGREDMIVVEEPVFPRAVMCSDAEQAARNCRFSQGIHNGTGGNRNGEMTDASVNAGIAIENGDENEPNNLDRKRLHRDYSRREAALIKFRQKRKDRCFEKKVRYHSRQKLAEQRPRIKGQFVRASAIELKTATAEEDDGLLCN